MNQANEAMVKEKIMETALRSIAALWPELPNCADVMSVSGVNDGRSRAILLDGALKIARKALKDAEAVESRTKYCGNCTHEVADHDEKTGECWNGAGNGNKCECPGLAPEGMPENAEDFGL